MRIDNALRVIHSISMDPPVVLFRLVHFNDAYVPTLAPRWATFAKSLDSSIVTCGGDVFNPSLLSSVTKGKHMPQVLNALNVKVAVVGNHVGEIHFLFFFHILKSFSSGS